MEHKGPIANFFFEIIKEVKIRISRNVLLHRIEIFMKFSSMYTFFRFDQGKVCLCTSKVKASGQETGLDSNLESLTSIFGLQQYAS